MSGIVAMAGGSDIGTLGPMLGRIEHRGKRATRLFPGNGMALGCACGDQNGSGERPTRHDGEPPTRLVADARIYTSDNELDRLSAEMSPEDAVGLLAQDRMDDHTSGPRDGGFAFALMQSDHLLVARDPLGIKPLYWAEDGGAMYFASEVKALCDVGAPIHAFPPGCLYDSRSGFARFFEFVRPAPSDAGPAEAAAALHTALEMAVRRRIPATGETGVLLSGGLDSSVVAVLARRETGALHTFSTGTADSEDLDHARAMAGMLGTRHHEHVFTAVEARRILPQVIYYLESFDYPLVRSAIANYLASCMAGDHVPVVLCGEGADELFAGYDDLKRLPPGELDDRLEELSFGCHNTGLQRVDRMNTAHGVSGRMPFLDWEVVDLAFSLPAAFKLHEGRVEKWIVRQAFSEDLPGDIAWRGKQKFSVGSGASGLMADIAEQEVSDRDFAALRRLRNGFTIRNKEEMLYFLIFRDFLGDDPAVLDTVGITPTT